VSAPPTSPAPTAGRLAAVLGAAAADAWPEAVQDLEALCAASVGGAGAPVGITTGHPATMALLDAQVARFAAATETVPASWIEALSGMAVRVPSTFTRDVLERCGLPAGRAQVVTPTIDLAAFSPQAAAVRAPGARGFVFLATCDWTRASGWDALVRAYAEEFAADEDVSLVLAAFSSLGYTAPQIGEALIAVLDETNPGPGDLPDVILEVSAAHARPSPSLLRGADCVVSPARGDAWARRPLEAMACGLPVIATRWGTAADLLDPDVALLLAASVVPVDLAAARETPELTGGRWAEPDHRELRRLLRTAFTDRPALAALGRRARAHVEWAHDAQHVAAQLDATPAGGGRFPARVPRAGRARRAQEVSFVLQGPVERVGSGRTARACETIRAHFPGAEIVLSTWRGAQVEGIDADVIVESKDPGPVGSSPANQNTNRQLVSTLAGIRAAGRPLVAKVRSDMLFVSDALLSHWGRWEERTDELRLFDRRVLVPDVFMRRPSHLCPRPLHPSDWSFLGTRTDLETLFDVPLMRASETLAAASATKLTRLYCGDASTLPSHTPEQWVWLHALRKVAPGLRIEHTLDLTPETLRLTELSVANNLAVLDMYTQYGVWCPKYPAANRLLPDHTLLQHGEWLELYTRICGGGAGQADRPGLLAGMRGRQDALTREDAGRLRAAGLSWEAQLLETVLLQPRLRRDPTTGGHGRWLLDVEVAALAREELRTRLDDGKTG